MRTTADRAMATLARFLVGVFFRSVEVEGAEHLGAGPTVLVANHQNGLVDPVVLMAALDRFPRFIAKATLWKILPLRPLLALAGAIPVRRIREVSPSVPEEERTAANDAAFAASRQLLGAGGLVAIFPEGISHDEVALQALRTGAARIAVNAGPPTVVTAAGLVYDDKSRFRSRVLVRLGPARSVAPYPDDADGVRAMTAAIAGDLRSVAPDFTDRDAARRWTRLAGLGPDPALSMRDAVARRLSVLAEDPVMAGELQACVAELDDLEQRLALLGLSPDDLLRHRHARSDRGLVGGQAVALVGAAPATAAGILIHIVPWEILRLASSRSANVGVRATIKVLGSMLLYPLSYTTVGVVVGRRRGWRAGLAAAAIGPVGGWTAVRTGERLEDIGGLARLRDVLRRDRTGLAELRRRQEALAERVAAVLTEPAPA